MQSKKERKRESGSARCDLFKNIFQIVIAERSTWESIAY